MASHNSVFVLYKVANSKDDQESPLYNAFQMERNPSGGLTLADIKQHCLGLRRLNASDGGDAYHWRVRMEDKPKPGHSTSSTFKWWDIKDDKSRLPIKENFGVSELAALYNPANSGISASSVSGATSSSGNPSNSSSTDAGGRPLGAAARGFGKMIKNAAKEIDEAINSNNTIDPNEPRVSVIAFKLLDLAKVNNQFNVSSSSYGDAPLPRRRPRASGSRPEAQRGSNQANAAPIPSARPMPAAAARPTGQRPLARPTATARPVPPPRSAGNNVSRQMLNGSAHSTSSSLLDFGAAPAATSRNVAPSLGSLRHTASTASTSAAFSNESKEEKLKREYKQKAATQNRVWDAVDERWVVVDPSQKGPVSHQSSNTSAPPGSSHEPAPKQNIKGISLENANTAGKTASVAAAMNDRVNDMKASQAKAKQEFKAREEYKKNAENEEDEVRKRLEPKVKVWSEEHGQKKKLTALLSSMHTILWDGAKWKQVSLGDLLDDKKLRRCYLKATLVVHPDKTADLDAEKRFLAKRIFDALSQAHAELNK
jgi:hypothetical protein